MTSFDDLDRRLTARLDERAAPRAPDSLTEAITKEIDGAPQRPAWATLERWIPMETRAQFGAVPRAVTVLALLALLTLVTATAIAIGASTTPKLPEPFGPAANGLIAYVSDGQIHVVESNGNGHRQVTFGPGVYGTPTWSRDGTALAYWSEAEEGPTDLFVMDADGGNPIVLATATGDVNGMAWSADSSEIMYSTVVEGLGTDPCPVSEFQGGACGSRLFVVATDGSSSPRMVGDPELDARGPELSPNHSTVAFGGGEAASEALFLMHWDGSDIRRLDGVDAPGGWAFAKQSWSADGELIVTHDGGTPQRVWLVEPDGSGAEVVESPFESYWPTYAPDGSAIIWGTSSSWTIWKPVEGSEPVMFRADEIDWAPDGSLLAGIRVGNLILFDLEGNDIAVVGPADGWPSWQRVAE